MQRKTKLKAQSLKPKYPLSAFGFSAFGFWLSARCHPFTKTNKEER